MQIKEELPCEKKYIECRYRTCSPQERLFFKVNEKIRLEKEDNSLKSFSGICENWRGEPFAYDIKCDYVCALNPVYDTAGIMVEKKKALNICLKVEAFFNAP